MGGLFFIQHIDGYRAKIVMSDDMVSKAPRCVARLTVVAFGDEKSQCAVLMFA